VLESATLREETRGAHARSDFPELSEAWRCRIVHGSGDLVHGTAVIPTTPEAPVGAGGGS